MQSTKRHARMLVWLAGGSILAAPAAAQPPATTGVVVVRAAGDTGAPGGPSAEAVELGFVASTEHVVASVAADVTDFVVSGADGVEHEACLVAYDEAVGLGLLEVPGGLPAAYRFARDPAQAAQEVHGATRNDAGVVTLVPGQVQDVQPDAVRHDAFNDQERNMGAPLLNSCGEIVGAAIDDSVVNPAAAGSGLAASGAWVLARFAGDGLTATAVETPCLPDVAAAEAQQRAVAAAEARQRAEAAELAAAEAQQQAEAAELAVAEAQARAEAAEAARQPADPAQAEAAAVEARQQAEAAVVEAQQRAEAAAEARRQADVARAEAAELAVAEAQARAEAAELAAAEAQRQADVATAEARQEAETAAAEAQAQAEAAAEAQRRAERAAAEAQEQVEAEAEARQQAEAAAAEAEREAADSQEQIIRWSIVAAGIVSAIVLLLWIASRRSVAAAKRDQIKMETLAQAAISERDERDLRVSEVPAVFLDGVDADGRPISVRIPGSTIAADGGAVVGRNPFDSTVVLDHPGVSRRHFRLFTRGTSVLIEDLNSTNGTKLSDAALTPGASAPLQRGATLQVGDLALTVTLQS